MKIKYRKYGIKYSPEIKVVLKYKGNIVDLYALIDSGADICIFPSEVGVYLGLNAKSVEPEKALGIGNKEIPTYIHNLRIIILGREFPIKCGFIDKLPKALLGRDGFFNRFIVKFHHSEKYMDIKPFVRKLRK